MFPFSYEDYLTENDRWFLIDRPDDDFVWFDENDFESFDTKDAVFTWKVVDGSSQDA